MTQYDILREGVQTIALIFCCITLTILIYRK